MLSNHLSLKGSGYNHTSTRTPVPPESIGQTFAQGEKPLLPLSFMSPPSDKALPPKRQFLKKVGDGFSQMIRQTLHGVFWLPMVMWVSTGIPMKLLAVATAVLTTPLSAAIIGPFAAVLGFMKGFKSGKTPIRLDLP